MARTEITFFTAGNRSPEGGTIPVSRTTGMITEVLTSSGASAATSTISTAPKETGFVRIHAAANIWAVAGASPAANIPLPGASGSGLPVKAGTSVDLPVSRRNRVAVIEE